MGVITSAREGAVTGGPAFLSAVGDDVLDGVITENIGNLAEQEKWNEITVSSAWAARSAGSRTRRGPSATKSSTVGPAACSSRAPWQPPPPPPPPPPPSKPFKKKKKKKKKKS